MTTRVVLVDDHDLIRGGLRRAFDADEEFEVVGEAASVGEACTLLQRIAADVCVVDIGLPDRSGIELVSWLRGRDDKVGIVVLTMYDGDAHLFAALEAGASGFVTKSAPATDVIAAARHAAASPTSFAASDLAGAMRRRMSGDPLKLSNREQEVLVLLKEGLPVSAIARRLYISQSTAKTHISKIYEKLGASNRTQAVMEAIRRGLVSADDSQVASQ